MLKWIKVWLKWFFAREELEALERYRLAIGQVQRWNAGNPHSARTADWLGKMGEGKPAETIGQLRESFGWDYKTSSFTPTPKAT